MTPMRSLCLVLLCLLPVGGCSATFQNHKGSALPPAEQYRQKALALEKEANLQEALFAWRVAAKLDPNNPRTPTIINTLERATLNAAKTHYQKGLTYLHDDARTNARREFLITLRLMPTHYRAKEYLKHRLNTQNKNTYIVQAGDSYTKIATRVYNDPSKAYIIAYFNDLDPQKPLFIGKSLSLPVIDARHLLPRADIAAFIEMAETALDQKRYDDAITAARRIKEEIPNHTKARLLENTAQYQKGLALFESKDYASALEALNEVDSSFKGRYQAIRKINRQISLQTAAEKQRVARTFLEKKDYDSVIRLTMEFLSQNPNDPVMKELSTSAHYALGKMYIERSEDAKAIEVLSVIDKNYEDTSQLLAQARGSLNAQAEAYYRKGVKHFLNEELEQAIQAWKETLKLNPNHPKAGQDIENALRLLNKWQGLDKDQ